MLLENVAAVAVKKKILRLRWNGTRPSPLHLTYFLCASAERREFPSRLGPSRPAAEGGKRIRRKFGGDHAHEKRKKNGTTSDKREALGGLNL